EEDARADVDMNFVITGEDQFIEVQGTAEGAAFSREQLDALTSIALRGATGIREAQAEALRGAKV
ncbi:MAG: ribonuclease PH, partial [Myxococcota bacterium]